MIWQWAVTGNWDKKMEQRSHFIERNLPHNTHEHEKLLTRPVNRLTKACVSQSRQIIYGHLLTVILLALCGRDRLAGILKGPDLL